MSGYADGAEAFFAPGVSALIATNVLKCTHAAYAVNQSCRLLLNAATQCRDGAKLFDANWLRFLTIARDEYGGDAEVTMRLCNLLANACMTYPKHNIPMAMEMGAPRIAAEALRRHVGVTDTAAGACCMIGNINGPAKSSEIAREFEAAGAIDALFAAAAVHEEVTSVARRVCAALGSVSFLAGGPAFHRRIADTLLRLNRLHPEDADLVRFTCAAFKALREHGDMDRYLLQQGALAVLTHIIRANEGNTDLAVKAAGCMSMLLFEWRVGRGASTEDTDKLPPPFTALHLVEAGTAEALITLLRRCVSVGGANLSFVVTALEMILSHLGAARVKQLAVRACIALVDALRLQLKLRVEFLFAQGIVQCLEILMLHATAADGLDRLAIVDTLLAALQHYHNTIACFTLASGVLRNLAAEAPTRAQIMHGGTLDELCKQAGALRSLSSYDSAAAFCSVIRNLAIVPENRLELLLGDREAAVTEAVKLVALRNFGMTEIGDPSKADEPSLWAAWGCAAALAMEPGNCAALVKAQLAQSGALQLYSERCSAQVAWAVSGFLLRALQAAVAAAATDGGALYAHLSEKNPVGGALAIVLTVHSADSRVVAAAAAALHALLTHLRVETAEVPAGSFDLVKAGLIAALRAQEALGTAAAERAHKHVNKALAVIAEWKVAA